MLTAFLISTSLLGATSAIAIAGIRYGKWIPLYKKQENAVENSIPLWLIGLFWSGAISFTGAVISGLLLLNEFLAIG
jgi:hypothetical protein